MRQADDIIARLIGIAGIGLLIVFLMERGDSARPLADPMPQDAVVMAPVGDPAVAKAKTEALAHLDHFLALAATEPKGWSLVGVKVRMHGTSRDEVIWVAEFREIADGQWKGRLSNEPEILPGLHQGDWVSFEKSAIEDWMFAEHAVIWGGYSTRVLLPKMKPMEQNAYRAVLSKTPAPPGW